MTPKPDNLEQALYEKEIDTTLQDICTTIDKNDKNHPISMSEDDFQKEVYNAILKWDAIPGFDFFNLWCKVVTYLEPDKLTPDKLQAIIKKLELLVNNPSYQAEKSRLEKLLNKFNKPNNPTKKTKH